MRQGIFQTNNALDAILAELKNALMPLQFTWQSKIKNAKFPIGLVVGNPRSGTTLFMQWIASLGVFSYPSNLINRFAYAPYIGSLVQEMICNPKYDFANELTCSEATNKYKSNLGKTKGLLAPNEFQHYFRNYLSGYDPQYLTPDVVQKVDFKNIIKGLNGFEIVFSKPVITKAVMIQYNLDAIFQHTSKAIIFYIKRDPVFNMQSIYLARQKYYGNSSTWWSVKPKEYSILKDLDIFHQIAGQVFYTNQRILNQLVHLRNENKILIDYSIFCDNPSKVYKSIREIYSHYNYSIPVNYSGPNKFLESNSIKISKSELHKFEKAYDYFSQNEEKAIINLK